MNPTLIDPFLAAAQRTPSNTAVVSRDQQITYGMLERRSRELALELKRLGTGPGDRVGVLIPKSIEAVVAVLGILRSGAAYVPVDTQSPPTRQLAILKDCRVRGLISTLTCQQRLAAILPTSSEFDWQIELSSSAEPGEVTQPWVEGKNRTLPELARGQTGDAAYILYTSGSTGRPKGVVISHSAAIAFVEWAIRTFSIGPNDRLANVAQFNFDLSILDLFGALSTGAQVHLIPSEAFLKPSELVDAVRRAQITQWYSVPSALGWLVKGLEQTGTSLPQLKRILFAGEVFPLPQLRRAQSTFPDAEFHNLFGPTETNVCTHFRVPAPIPQDASAIPIGTACQHLTVLLLDDQGCPCPPGAEGELCVAGPGIMTEYYGQPELTDRAFWPANTVPGTGRLYRTGDRAVFGLDQQFWFLGRRDRQLKLRGYRVELGEIEAVLAELPGAQETMVIAVPSDEGFRLHAVVVPEAAASLDVLGVKAHCGQRLPPYMVPSTVEFTNALPRTDNGKVDRMRQSWNAE